MGSVLGEHLGDEERELQSLLVVEAWVAHRLVALLEVCGEDLLGPPEALGDVIAGQLDVDAAGVGAEAPMDLEEAPDLVDDVVEVACLVAGGRLEGVAVHRVADPHHARALGGDPLDEGRQGIADLPGAHPGDEGQPPRGALRVELVDDLDDILRVGLGAELDPDGVVDAGDELQVSAVELAGALTDPDHVPEVS